MSQTATNRTYFTPSDVGEIVDHLMGIPIAGGLSSNKKVAATQALNVIHILRDKLGAGSAVLQLIYTDETIVPKKLARLVREYLNGKYNREEAEGILDELQADMRKNYFQRKIPFDDTAKLPRTEIFDPTGEFSTQIKKTLEIVVAEYEPRVNYKVRGEELYRQACNNPTGNLDFDALAGGLAEIIARKEYSSLVLSIGDRDPTPQEFANRYLNALHTAYHKLGTPTADGNIDREAVLKDRNRDEVYQRELKIYKNNLGGLLIL